MSACETCQGQVMNVPEWSDGEGVVYERKCVQCGRPADARVPASTYQQIDWDASRARIRRPHIGRIRL